MTTFIALLLIPAIGVAAVVGKWIITGMKGIAGFLHTTDISI